MSIAPANRASIADGPALKLFQSILTFEPMARSNHPLALPAIACGCVILGNAPTRMTVCAHAEVSRLVKNAKISSTRLLIFSPVPVHDHWQQATWFRFFLALTFPFSILAIHDVGQSGVLKNLCRRVSHVQKHSIQRA